MNRSLDKESEFFIDKDLAGSSMREQMFRFYNMLGYWTERSTDLDSRKKILTSTLEQVKDMAKYKRLKDAKSKSGLTAVDRDLFVRDCWEEEVEINGELVTLSLVQQTLNKILSEDNESRNNILLCRTAIDICRSALSWDKQEAMSFES